MKMCSGECSGLLFPSHKPIVFDDGDCPIKEWLEMATRIKSDYKYFRRHGHEPEYPHIPKEDAGVDGKIPLE